MFEGMHAPLDDITEPKRDDSERGSLKQVEG